MTAFYVLNLFLAIVLIASFYLYIMKFFKLNLLNPITFMFLPVLAIEVSRIIVAPAIFIYDGGLFNKYFQFAILMTNVENTVKLIMLYFIFYFMQRNYFVERILSRLPRIKMTKRKIYYVSLIFLFLYLLFFVLLMVKSIGIAEWLFHPRRGYEQGRTGLGHLYAISLSCLSFSFVLAAISIQRTFRIFIVAVLYISFVYFLGSKGFILSFGIFTLIVLWLRGYKHLGKTSVMLGVIISVLILVNLAQSYSTMEWTSIFQYFDFYINSAKYYQMYFDDQIKLFYGEIFLSSFWELVPRGIYPDKPFAYGKVLINDIIWPGLAEKGNTPGFGGPVAKFGDFGIIGIILLNFLNITFIFLIVTLFLLYKYISLEKLRTDSIYLYIFVFMLAPAYLKYFAFPLNIVMFIIMVKIFSISMRVKI